MDSSIFDLFVQIYREDNYRCELYDFFLKIKGMHVLTDIINSFDTMQSKEGSETTVGGNLKIHCIWLIDEKNCLG